MRIGLLHYAAAPVVGGVESILAAHARVFARQGHEVRTIAQRGSPDILLREGDKDRALREAVEGCDVVMVHNVLTMPFDLPLTEALWRLAEEMTQIRWIAWVHDLAACNPDYERPWHQPPWDRLARACPHFTYVAVSEHRARQFAVLTGGEARVISNGVDPAAVLGLTDKVRELAEANALLERDLVLVQPTRLLRRKNVELGLAVVAELRRRGRDAVTLITAAADPHNVASNAYAADLRRERDELGLRDTALFVGDFFPVADADVASLYTLADALFFPSRQEGFGLPIIEAALHRLPIFCADVDPMNNLLEHGLHVFDPDTSADEIASLIERTVERSPAHRARREAARRYAWATIWREQLEPLLR
jgi:glycosyltransferase involved in cell wall biosynthesis